MRHGFRASASLPLIVGGTARGTFNLYAEDAGFFDVEEEKLLVRLAADISFALEMSEREGERRRANESLAASEVHLRTLVETVPDLIWLKDVNGVYLTCNHTFERFFGAVEADIIGKTDYDFVDRELADFFREHDRKAMEAGKPSSNEELVTFADDGHRALLETVKTPMFDAEGKLIGILGIARDITGQRALEEQLRQSQKMETIGALAGGIAHDFNNILTAIIGYTQITLRKMPEGDPLRHYVEQILAASDRAAHLTKDLLLFSRKQTSECKRIDLNDTIRKSEIFLRRIIRADIRYKTDLKDAPLPLFADSYQLEQVMMNLATNTCDAMPGGGTLTVVTDKVELDEAFIKLNGFGIPGQYIRLTVYDTGLGMDEQTQLRVFEPFFTTKEVGKGTGLGLAVVYGIIRQHYGYITVSSRTGEWHNVQDIPAA